ncbi:MAG: CRTAC1 family protein [Planctomycetes bacterium]|nr:CRTAC1 family protein [Planctomycetota bacterium]
MNADKRPFFASLGAVRHTVLFHKSLAIAWLLLGAGASWAAGCGAAVDGPPFNHDAPSKEPVGAAKQQVSFGDVTEAVGLEGMSGGEAAWGDFNNDGWVDLCAGGQVWRNEQGKRFVKIADLPGSALWGDFDNDGRLDLFCYGTGRLFRNLNGEAFQEMKIVPPLPTQVSLGATWGDFNRDGFLDLYVGGYEVWPSEEFPDVLLLSEKGERFVETWRQTKIHRARGVTAADFDEDGHLDVFVSNYRLQPNLLWKNDGQARFTDVALGYGAAGNEKLGAYGHTIGSCWGDLDNDGHLDLFVGNFSHPPDYQDRPQFLRNRGPQGQFHFEDRTKTAALRWQESYASPTLGDYDNDGWLDLYFTTVYPGDESVLYRNQGAWEFTEIPSGAGLSRPQTYQAAWADFDNDGQLDIVTGGRLLRNPGHPHHWLKVRLEGAGAVNDAAIGAQVRLRCGDHTLTRSVEGATGQGNQNDLTLHFGLGNRGEDVELEIRWPDGSRQTVKTAVDRVVTIKR